MNNKTKLVLVHPDKQHSFKTAKALIEAGTLERYITTVYDKPGSLTHLCTKLCRGAFKKKLQAHRSSEIPDSSVKQYTEFLSLLLLIMVRIDKSKKLYSKLKMLRDKLFNKKVARYCIKNNIDAVISFDVVSAQLYKALDKSNVVKIIDMSAPQYSYMCSLFEKEIEKYPDSSLTQILNAPLTGYWRTQSEYEIKMADAFLAASDFTKASLVMSGADEDKIYKCVYGINHDFFNSEDRIKETSETLKCVYVGNITEQKGFRYLFEAIRKIRSEGVKVNFTMIGAYNPEDTLIKEAMSYCEFTGHILPTRLKEILLQSDVVVFPSLADGFGFSVLEAMACGVVPICSLNAGVSDLIKHEENGLLISAMDSEAIYEGVIKLYENRELLHKLSAATSKSAKAVVWSGYYDDVNNSVDKILKKAKT